MGAVGEPELVLSRQSAFLFEGSVSASASQWSHVQDNRPHSSVWLLSVAQCCISPAVQLPGNSKLLA